jgi:hypothetical protein
MYLLLSTDSDFGLLGNHIKRAGFAARLVAEHSIFIESFLLYELTVQSASSMSPGLGPTLPRVGGVFFYEEAAALTLQQGHSLRRSAPQHVELVSKNQDFRLKPCSRPEQPG